MNGMLYMITTELMGAHTYAIFKDDIVDLLHVHCIHDVSDSCANDFLYDNAAY
jgi:hypothetical protein